MRYIKVINLSLGLEKKTLLMMTWS